MDNQPTKTDAELKLLMKACWNKYQLSGDITHLIEAVRAAPFFGERELASEIARPVSYTHLTLPTICSV